MAAAPAPKPEASAAPYGGMVSLRSTGHPVSGQKLKPTYLTSEPLLRGRTSVLEVAVDTKKSELRIGVVHRPEYLRIADEEGGAGSFHSSSKVDCVAYFLMWKKGAALAYGNDRQPTMGAVTVSAGDTVRLEVDRTNPKELAAMNVFANQAKIGVLTLPANWDDICFGVQCPTYICIEKSKCGAAKTLQGMKSL